MSKQYQLYVDHAPSFKNDHIDVLPAIVEAKNAKEAWEIMFQDIASGKYKEEIGDDEFYIWECTEEDLIDEGVD